VPLAARAIANLRAVRARAVAAVVCLLAVVSAGDLIVESRVKLWREDETVTEMREIIERYSSRGGAVLVWSTGVSAAYPALTQLDRKPGSRYLWMFPLPMLLDGPAHDAASEARFLADVEGKTSASGSRR